MSRSFDGELSNQSGAGYRSENNDWAQDWLTNRSGSGLPSTILAYGTYFDTNDNIFRVRNAGNTTSYTLFSSDGYFRPRNGSATTPSFSFANDTDTGAYLPSDGSYAIATAGSARLTISTANVLLSLPTTVSGTSSSPLVLYRTANSGSHYTVYQAQNSLSAQTTYAQVGLTITTNTSGAEVGSFVIRLVTGGSVRLHTTFAGAGSISTGTSAVQITNAAGTLRHAAIEQNGATSGQVLAWNGSAWAPSAAGSGTVSGSGTINRYSYWTTTSALGAGRLENTGTGTIAHGNFAITGRLTAGSGLSPETVITDATGQVLLSALDNAGGSNGDVIALVAGVPAWSTILGLNGQDGSAAAPTFGFSSSAGNGLYLAAANTPALASNSVERMRLGSTELVINEGSADYDVRIESDTNANAFFFQGSNGAIGYGTDSPSFHQHATNDTSYNVTWSVAVASTAAAILRMRKARGTHASPGATSSGDSIMRFIASAYHSTGTPGYVDCAEIRCQSDGAGSGDTIPSRWVFLTMPSGGSLTERMRISSAGIVTIGVDDSSAGNLYLYGGSGTTAPEFRLYTPADEDTTVNYWSIMTDQASGNDEIQIGPSTDTDMFRFVGTGSLLGTFLSYAAVAAGMSGTVRGSLVAHNGTGTNQPGVLSLLSRSGTQYFFWVTNAGVLRVHTAAPTADTDGSPV